MRSLVVLLAILLGCRTTPSSTEEVGAPASETGEPSPAARLIGTTPPEWHLERWLGSSPRTLESLRGSIVLVRWWTAGCPYCAKAAPALKQFEQTYGPRGLRVIGVYHHKGATDFDPVAYEETVRKRGFAFPVAYDPGWRTLDSWMRDRDGTSVETGWTSVTFLLDRRGVIRHVHPGGSYAEGDPAYAELTTAIERLLADP